MHFVGNQTNVSTGHPVGSAGSSKLITQCGYWFHSSLIKSTFISQTRFTEFSTEGLLWIPNLCVPDSTLIIPVAVGLTFLFNCEVNSLAQSDSDRLSPEEAAKQKNKWTTRFLRGLSIAMIPIASVVPSGVALYWTVSGLCGVAVNLALKSPNVRRAVRIPLSIGESETPYRNIATNLKNIIMRRR